MKQKETEIIQNLRDADWEVIWSIGLTKIMVIRSV